MVGVAQLVRAPDCDSGGRGFETHLSPAQYALRLISKQLVIPARMFLLGNKLDHLDTCPLVEFAR